MQQKHQKRMPGVAPLSNTEYIKFAPTQVRFGRYTDFRKACFTGHYYSGNSIAAAEKTFIFVKKTTKKKHVGL